MQRIRDQLDDMKEHPTDAPHDLFKFYGFSPSVFTISENRDYSKYSVVVKDRGGRNYYVPFGWKRFGLRLKTKKNVAFNETTCVGFFTADIQIIKEIVTTGKFTMDKSLNAAQGLITQYVYVTPFIDYLEFSGRPCEMPRDLGLNIGGSLKFRVVLQCRVPSALIVEVPDPSPYYSQNIRENSVWRVPSDSIIPYAICIKQLE